MEDDRDADSAPDVDRAAQLLDALGDPVARRMLVDGVDQSVTAEDIANAEDVSRSTVYRRIDTLRRLGLVEETTGPHSRPGAGTQYRTVINTFLATVTASGLEVQTGSDVAGDDLETAVKTLLEALDVTEAVFDFEAEEVTLTLTDGEALARVFEVYRTYESSTTDR